MRTASVKLVVCCALCAVLGGASTQLLMQSQLAVESRLRPGVVGGGSIRAERFDPPQRLERSRGAESAAPEVAPRSLDHAGLVSRADAIVHLAATDPGGAMDRALAIESHWLRRDTVVRVAAVWAERAPNEAVAFAQAARELDPAIRSAVRSRVLEVWALTDPGRALGFMFGRDGQNLFFFDGRAGRRFARELARQQPHELLSATNGLPRGLARSELRSFAIASLVERDLVFALREAALAAPGFDRRQWVTAIDRIHPGRAEELGLCGLDAGVCGN